MITNEAHTHEEQGCCNCHEEHSDCGCHEGHDHEEGGKSEIAKLAVGAAIFAAGMIMTYFTNLNMYIPLAAMIISYIILGGEVLLQAAKNVAKGRVFDENFLMSVATIGAFLIGEYPEAAAVMLFYQIGEYFQGAAVRRSRKSIAELMDIRPDFANILTLGGSVEKVAPESVRTGDHILIRPGERIPLDGVVTEGESMLDCSALTGESLPRRAAKGDSVLSGCINQNAVLTVRVTKVYGESTAAKILELVENASSKKAPTENFITAFSRYYTPVVVGLALLIAVIPPIFTGAWAEWVNRGLVFLVISCPCALVISIPLGFFGGIGAASKRGILVKGGNYLEALGKLDTVVFDKTGTLTRGSFKVTEISPAGSFTSASLLTLAARAESFSTHPIARSIIDAYGGEPDKSGLSEYNEISGHGVHVQLGGKTVLAGSGKLMRLYDIPFGEAQTDGTTVHVASGGEYAGYIVISDEVKPDSREAVNALKARGVAKTVMLSGDNPQIAEKVGRELGLDEVYGGLLPDGKLEKLEALLRATPAKRKLAFVGDGINDAPTLARADVGIAMGGLGSDAAIEAADVVLMTDEPAKLAEAIDIARFTGRIVWQNIAFALGVKGVFLLLGAFGVATLWEAVFADVGVALLAVLNATRVINRVW